MIPKKCPCCVLWKACPDEIPELLEYMEDVLPEASKEDTDMLSDVVVDVLDYLEE